MLPGASDRVISEKAMTYSCEGAPKFVYTVSRMFSLFCIPVLEVGNLFNMFVGRLAAEVGCSRCYCNIVVCVKDHMLPYFVGSLANATLRRCLSDSDCRFSVLLLPCVLPAVECWRNTQRLQGQVV